jgi:hypothetical protein
MKDPTQTFVQVAAKEDAKQMAEVLYEGLYTAKYWKTIYPSVKRDDWIDAQADYCLQHIDEPGSVACVVKDGTGNVSGMAYGRIINVDRQPKCRPIIGRDDSEYQKIDNAAFHSSLVEKYRGVFCERQIPFPFHFSLVCHPQG